MINLIADYHENIRDLPAIPDVKPGYMREVLPKEAPQLPESWSSVVEDINKAILPGSTHWHSPRFHAYYPSGNSYPAILGGILGDAIGCIGFTWMANPACTELEMITMDWLVKMSGLPDHFLHTSPGKGGGVIQGSASESTLVALLAAKKKKLKEMGDLESDQNLVCYMSKQAHSSIERAALLANMKMRVLDTDSRYSLRGDKLSECVQQDKAQGLVPCFIVATLGTTNVCSFDHLRELGEVARQENMWIHVDAAYAGAAMICPEHRHLMDGVELIDSFVFNCHKWLMVNFDCSAMFVRDSSDLVDAFNVDPHYLKHDYQKHDVPDFRHWQLPLGRRFRSLKLWLVLKSYGVVGLQEHVRKQISLARHFETLVASDCRFSVFFDVTMGLVTFRYDGSNDDNEELQRRINGAGKIYMTPANVDNKIVMRFVVGSRLTEVEDVEFAWRDIVKHAGEMEEGRTKGGT